MDAKNIVGKLINVPRHSKNVIDRGIHKLLTPGFLIKCDNRSKNHSTDFYRN